MPFSLTTQSRPAFQSMTDGLQAVERYYEKRRSADIERAQQCIDTALSQDQEYGLAIFYKGVVLDLIGKPADAPRYFEKILEECDSDELRLETKFNLGVVNYHRYGHAFLERASHYFDEVIAKTPDSTLRSLAEAYLAQTHAMWMRPSLEQLPDKREPVTPAVRDHIEQHFQKCQDLVTKLRQSVRPDSRLIATYENANGMSHMYYTDHVARDPTPRRQYLEHARASLLEADHRLPDDWANTCDLASLELRFGVLERDEKQPPDVIETHFAASRDRLQHVIDTLRPEYGFALYELGILQRLWRNWTEADASLQRALQVPEPYRDISDKGVQEQLARVAQRDASYP